MQQLLIAYKNDLQQLVYNLYNGELNNYPSSAWSGEQIVPANTLISGTPSFVEYNNLIYCFFQGCNENGYLMYNIFDPATNSWLGNNLVPSSGPVMSGSPSAVVYDNYIYVFYQGPNNNGELCYDMLLTDGSWTGNQQVYNTNLSASPSAIVFQDQIFVFHQGNSDSQQLWCNIMTGAGFQGDTLINPNGTITIGGGISPVEMTGSPFAVAIDGMLYCYFQTGGGFLQSIAWTSPPGWADVGYPVMNISGEPVIINAVETNTIGTTPANVQYCLFMQDNNLFMQVIGGIPCLPPPPGNSFSGSYKMSVNCFASCAAIWYGANIPT